MTSAPLRLLVLTDHSNHSDSNSLYVLMQHMKKNPKCGNIDVASRGNSINDGFFHGMSSEKLYARRIGNKFRFRAENNMLESKLFEVDLKEYDFVFLRLPRPISDTFLLWISDLFRDIPIINKPEGIINTSNKEYLLNFPDLCPPMKLCKSIEEVMEFSKQFPIVLKPLREYGGKGLLKISGDTLNDGKDNHDTTTYLKTIEKELREDGYLAMEFMNKVVEGDKRILVVGGRIMASSLRLPVEGSWLCNVAQGGTSVAATADKSEEELIAAIAPKMKAEGILIYGVDTLMGNDGKRILSEINTLSIGGFQNAQEQTGIPIIHITIHKMIEYADAQRG